MCVCIHVPSVLLVRGIYAFLSAGEQLDEERIMFIVNRWDEMMTSQSIWRLDSTGRFVIEGRPPYWVDQLIPRSWCHDWRRRTMTARKQWGSVCEKWLADMWGINGCREGFSLPVWTRSIAPFVLFSVVMCLSDIYIYIYTDIFIYTIYIYLYIFVYIYLYIFVYIYLYTYIFIYIYTFVYLYIYIYTYIYISIYSGYGKYSDPIIFFTLCSIAAIC